MQIRCDGAGLAAGAAAIAMLFGVLYVIWPRKKEIRRLRRQQTKKRLKDKR